MENQRLPISSSFGKFLYLLKMKGPLATSAIAKELNVTVEGARFQLLKLMEEGWVRSSQEAKGVGRPAQIWGLSDKTTTFFADNHAAFSEQLIASMQELLPADQLQQVIALREKKANEKYIEATRSISNLEEKIARLAELRNSDGYLAEWDKDEGGFMLIENHCPICAAAQRCADLCEAELNTFKEIFGKEVSIERVDHIIAGGRRCAYKINPLK